MKRFWLIRLLLWIKIRMELHRALMHDCDAMEFIQHKRKFPKYRKTLEVIASRSCTGSHGEDCIAVRPEQITKWCNRCLALDVLLNE